MGCSAAARACLDGTRNTTAEVRRRQTERFLAVRRDGLFGATRTLNYSALRYASISDTSRVVSVSRNCLVFSRSNSGSCALIHRKNRSREASANPGTLKTGWYGVGNPFSASIPNTAAAAAHKIVNSNVIGMNAGQLLNGLPPTFTG